MTRVAERGPTPPWRYAIGMFGTSIPINMALGSALLLYVEILGVPAATVAAVMAVYAVIDAIDNPILGHLSDRTRSRWGRRRPWLIVGAPLMVLCFIAVFTVPPGLTGVGLVVWFAVFMILTEAFDSMLNANYGALMPELFPQERRRSTANAMRQGFQLVALIISLALTPRLTTEILGTRESTEGFTRTALVYGVLALVVILYMAIGIRENPSYAPAERPSLVASFLAIVRNRRFWTIGMASACYLASMGLVLTGSQLYVQHSLGREPADTFYIMGVVIVFATMMLAFWNAVVRRFGAPPVWRWGFVMLGLGFVALFLARSLGAAIAAGMVLGVGYSALLATNDLIIARVLDEDARRSGQHREAMFLAGFGFFGRLSGVVQAAALWSIALFFGYESGDQPGADPGSAWRFYMTVVPFALCVLGAVVARWIHIPPNSPPNDSDPDDPSRRSTAPVPPR